MLVIVFLLLQDKEKAALDFKNRVSPDNKSVSSIKGLSFEESNELKLAKKRAALKEKKEQKEKKLLEKKKVLEENKSSKDNSKKSASLRWTEGLTKVFVEAMVEEAQVSTADGGFQSQSWNKLVLMVSTSAAGELSKMALKEVSKAQLQSKNAELKKKYSVFHQLVGNSGFGWDEDRCLPTADDTV